VTWPPSRAIIAPVNDAEKASVRHAQRALRVPETGDMDEATKGALRGVQSLFKAPVTGVLDGRTAELIDRLGWVPTED
jgi:hypothetical protein